MKLQGENIVDASEASCVRAAVWQAGVARYPPGRRDVPRGEDQLLVPAGKLEVAEL